MTNGAILINNDKVVIPIIYDIAFNFSDGLFPVEKDGKQGYIDKHGNEVIPLKYDIVNVFSEGFAAVCQDGKWGYMDKIANEVVPIIYDKVTDYNEGFACVFKWQMWLHRYLRKRDYPNKVRCYLFFRIRHRNR